MNQIRRWLLAGAWSIAMPSCAEDDGVRLEPVPDCSSDDECVDADARYDRCGWVCEAHVTYCRVSCEVDSDCAGRGLPNDWVFCDIPRPGEGFCNQVDYDYGEDIDGAPVCVQEVGPVGEEDDAVDG